MICSKLSPSKLHYGELIYLFLAKIIMRVPNSSIVKSF